MLGVMFQLRRTNSYLDRTVTTRTQLGTAGESDLGKSDHKVAEFIFLTNREMQEQGQKEAGPKPADFDTRGEAMGSSWGIGRTGTVGESPKGTGWFILLGGRQKTRPPTPTPVVLLQTQGQQHRVEGGGNRGNSLPICSQNHPIAKPYGKG